MRNFKEMSTMSGMMYYIDDQSVDEATFFGEQEKEELLENALAEEVEVLTDEYTETMAETIYFLLIIKDSLIITNHCQHKICWRYFQFYFESYLFLRQ